MRLTHREFERVHICRVLFTSAWEGLLGALGTPEFDAALATLLREMCNLHWFAAVTLSNGELREFASYGRHWIRSDTADSVDVNSVRARIREIVGCRALGVARNAATVQEVHFSGENSACSTGATKIVCATRPGSLYGLVIALKSEPIEPESSDSLVSHVGVLLTAITKHATMLNQERSLVRALESIAQIEMCLRSGGDLPPREAEVCARVLFGLSSLGISLDLCVSECTVKTYRRRAYQRLALGSERELLTWYLSKWSRWRHGQQPEAIAVY